MVLLVSSSMTCTQVMHCLLSLLGHMIRSLLGIYRLNSIRSSRRQSTIYTHFSTTHSSYTCELSLVYITTHIYWSHYDWVVLQIMVTNADVWVFRKHMQIDKKKSNTRLSFRNPFQMRSVWSTCTAPTFSWCSLSSSVLLSWVRSAYCPVLSNPKSLSISSIRSPLVSWMKNQA